MSTWHMKVWVIRVPDCDTRITRNKFGFCKLLHEIPEQNSGFGYFGFGFGFGYSGFGLQVFCPALWTGMPPAGWPGRRPSAEWTGHIKCWGDTSPASGMDRRRALSAINAGDARPRGLTSGSARWLTSRAVGHVAASGLRLSGEQERNRYGPDTCRLWTRAWPWLRPGYSLSQNPGTLLRVARTPHREVWDLSRGSGLYPRRSRTLPRGLVRICRGPTLSHGGPGPPLIPWRILSSLATWRP
jgi:hypothetical protein